MIRREPMKERMPHYVPAGAGCAPWALLGTSRLGGDHAGRWKIDRNRPLDWEKIPKYKGSKLKCLFLFSFLKI
jgi:hypothetical protein